MSILKRVSITLDERLVDQFDKQIKVQKYPTRSKAIGDLIRENLVKNQWIEGKEVAGAITLVYNHHKRDLQNKLTSQQHDFHKLIVSSQHIHLDHDNCLEIVVVKGNPKEIEKLAYRLKSTKGVKHGSLTMATTGKEI
ncbi:MAG: nickel-responsive transcriptional regulator NikR [Candidatus Edwardsbacteria bacterium]